MRLPLALQRLQPAAVETRAVAFLSLLPLLFILLWGCHAEMDSATIVVTHMEMLKNQSLMWGPYNPSLYFGMRPRIPDSLFTGMLWSRVEDFQSPTQSMSPLLPPLYIYIYFNSISYLFYICLREREEREGFLL